jgi:branched-chain amino acid transport system substrate-binding protein
MMVSRRGLAAAILAMTLSSWNAAQAQTYSLGVALGLTGTGAPYSREALEGIRLAVEEINAQGGLLGEHRIALHVGNTKTRPEVAETVVTDLIETKRVRAVIGTYSSATALAIKPICRDHKVLHIAPISNAEEITKLDPSPYTFSVVPNTYMMANATALGVATLARERDWKRYVTIASDYAWGRSSQEIQVDLLAKLAPDLELVESYWPPLGYIGFNSFAVAILNNKPDFVLQSIAGADNALWNRAAWDYRLVDDVAVPGGLISVTELVNEGRWILRGTYGRTRAPFFAHLDQPMMQAFVESYLDKNGRHPSDWAVLGYDAVQALRQGVEKAGSIDSEIVKDAMKGMTIETTRGKLFFREIDNQLSASAYWGRVADDPAYDFPIYEDLIEFKAEAIWRPEAEILAARERAGQ